MGELSPSPARAEGTRALQQESTSHFCLWHPACTFWTGAAPLPWEMSIFQAPVRGHRELVTQKHTHTHSGPAPVLGARQFPPLWGWIALCLHSTPPFPLSRKYVPSPLGVSS